VRGREGEEEREREKDSSDRERARGCARAGLNESKCYRESESR